MATIIDSVDHNRYEVIKMSPYNDAPTNVAVTNTPLPVYLSSSPDVKGTSQDAFGRLRVSNPFTLFDSQHRYQENDKWDTELTSGGTTTYLINESTVNLNVTTTSGSAVLRETKRVFPYQPGKSLLILSTFVMSAPKTDLTQRLGYYGAQNGVYFEQTGGPSSSTASTISGTTLTVGGTITGKFIVGQKLTGTNVVAGTYITALGTGSGGAGTYTVSISQSVTSTTISGSAVLNFVQRSYVTGSLVETRIPQSAWNGDKLDGTGPTGRTVDPTKSQIFWTDIEWLGVGDVRMGFVVDGTLVNAHTFHHDNVEPTTYMTTAILPIRYEIFNTATTSSNSTLKQICSTVISEGGYEGFSRRYNVDTGSVPVNLALASTPYPIISLRLNSSRLDSVILLSNINGIVTSNQNVQY